MDKAEECRPLNVLERRLRPRLKERYEGLCLQDEIRWRHRSRVLWLKAGDSNTKFFQRRANCRRSRNCISSISDGISSLASQADIAAHFSFFCNQQGMECPHHPSINLNFLYEGVSTDLSLLWSPFTLDEVKDAVFSSAPDKDPGPDGFSMLFYQRFWDTLKVDILAAFDGFFSGSVDLSPINSSWICPIPKKSRVLTARDLQPINLVHNLPKLISKVLATRLQGCLHSLINPHQAAFIRGRHILDNFCAHLLVHHLHSTKTRAVVLKLDFERAFDHVNWIFLKDVLAARGFGERWIGWIDLLLKSSSAAVLLNGVPGKPFSCVRGLR